MRARIFFAFSICFISAFTYAQDKYFIKTDGTKVEMHPTKKDATEGPNGTGVSVTDEWLFYFDMDGKNQRIKQLEVKELLVGGRYFMLLPITKRYFRLVEVLVTNDKYVGSSYYSDGRDYLFVHDKATGQIATNKIWYDRSANHKRIMPTLKKFFPDCNNLFERMAANSKAKRVGPFENIHNLRCE